MKSSLKRLRKASLLLLLIVLSVDAFGSSLLELYQETMASDPRLLSAEAESAIFQAREGASRGALLPQVTLGAQGTRTRRDSVAGTSGVEDTSYYNGERYYVSLSQPLYNKASWEAYRSADKESEQYVARLEETRGVIAIDLVDRYTKVLAAEDNFDFVRSERESAEEQLKLVRARYERKLASVTDFLSVEARVDILLSQELDAQNQVALARENMSEILGRSVTEPLASLRENLDVAWKLGTIDDWMRKGLATNKQLEANRLAVEAARGRVKEAAGQRHPSLTLSLNAQQSDIGYENAQTSKAETYVAAVNLSMPLYSGGQISAEVAEARARLRMAEQEYEQSNRLFRKGIREAYLNTKSAIQRVMATQKAVHSAEKSHEAQLKGF
jgi:Outer membrane protein